MANYYNKDTIQSMLDRLKAKQPVRDEYMKAKEFDTFMPSEIPNQAKPSPFYETTADSIMAGDETKTAIDMIMAQNQYNYQQMIREQRRKKRLKQQAQQSQNALQNAQQEAEGLSQQNPDGGSVVFGTNNTWNKKKWGADGIPQVSDLGQINPNAPIINAQWRGFNMQLNRQVAPIFVSFLEDLWQMGYRPASIGGHNDRNIAGTNLPSLHSYGLAIDIDPARNPVTNNGQLITDLPPGVGALARKYGLSWGGEWNSYKDPMHFSVPYGGRE